MKMQNKNNSVALTGNLGIDPIFKTLESGKKVARFSLAQHTYYNGNKCTHWFTVVIWGDLAEKAAAELNKGNRVSILGRLTTREYKKENEPRRLLTEVVASEFTRMLETEVAPEEEEALQAS